MKIKYSQDVDVLLINLSDATVYESDEVREGVIIDYDELGKIVRIETLDASKQASSPLKFEYELVAAGA